MEINKGTYKFIQKYLLLSDEDTDEILHNRSREELFAIYLTAIGLKEDGYYVMVENNINAYSSIPSGRSIGGCSCLYDVLSKHPYRYMKEGELFRYMTRVLLRGVVSEKF